MTFEETKKHVELVLRRAETEAINREIDAKFDPFNGWAVHKAVQTRAFAEGYAQGISDIFGLLGPQEKP